MTDPAAWQQAQVNRVGEAIKALRGDRSVQWVSDATAELGMRIGRSTIADFEIKRRKYVAAHELSMIAAALGVGPAVLLTWGTLPDGELEVLPGRAVDGLAALDWWGGEPMNPFAEAAAGLPTPHPVTTELVRACRHRAEVRGALIRSGIAAPGGWTYGTDDPGLVRALRDRLAGIVRRIRELGGVIRENDQHDG